jgi:hypothetical protein
LAKMSATMLAVLAVLAVLALVTAVAVAVRSPLPRDHEARRQARFRRAPAAVWDVITDHANEPSWRPGLRRVEQLADRDGNPIDVWKEVDEFGGEMLLKTVEKEPRRRLVWHIINGRLRSGGSWTIELEPDGEGTLMRIMEEGKVHRSLMSVVARLVIGDRETIDAYLRALGRRLGEDVVPG